MSSQHRSVFSFLSASPSAEMMGALDLGLGRSAAIWRNANDRMTYERTADHTFSLYLEGGVGTRRLDGGQRHGWPGAFCLMPQGTSSEWEITDVFEFVHLYVPDHELRRVFAETFDQDARLMVLPEATFDHAPALAGALRRLAFATRSQQPLMAEEAINAAFVTLLGDPRYGGARSRAIRGGLSPAVRRRLLDYIEAHLDSQITLSDLASIAGLSEFHLQRMFTASCGISPHGWVLRRRLARAKSLLAGSDPIAQIASACGFSSQSHMTRVFRAMTGTTPSSYRHGVAAAA